MGKPISPGQALTPTAKPPTLVLHKLTNVGDAEGKKTNKCLTGNIWGYRDPDIDRWLPASQPAQAGGPVGIYQLQNSEGTTFRQMAQAVLGTERNWSDKEFSTLLKKCELTFTLPAIEKLVERQEGGEDVGLRTDGWANFFFVEDADDSVSVLDVFRIDGGWNANVRRLDNGSGWDAGHRLVLRNSVTPTF